MEEVDDDNNSPQNTIISLTNFGLFLNVELIPTADPDYFFGVFNLVGNEFRSLAVLPDRELWCIPLQKKERVYYRAPFPPGPFPVRTRRKRCLYAIHIPRDQVWFESRWYYQYQYAFVILFPDMEIAAGFEINSLGQIGDAVLSPHRSTVSIPRDVLQNGEIAASILSIERNENCSFVLYVGAREVKNEVETAVRLFPAETALDTVENTHMIFRPRSYYWNECGPFSLVVSNGHQVDPRPREFGSRTIFSISIYMYRDVVELKSKEISKSESDEASELERGEKTDSENDVEML